MPRQNPVAIPLNENEADAVRVKHWSLEDRPRIWKVGSMSELDVGRRPAGGELYHLEIYHAGANIGDYERSKESEIPRKLREIGRSAGCLLSTHAEHGKFVVRWNGRDKEIRKYRDGAPDPGRQAQPLALIPRRYWTWA